MTVRIGDNQWPELQSKELIQVGEGADIGVGALDAGMTSGLPSVALFIPLPDGRVVFAETSLRLFLTAADLLLARFGDPRKASE
jgi:hypothetical protein